MVLRSLMRIQVLLFLLTAGLLVVLSTSEARALTGADIVVKLKANPKAIFSDADGKPMTMPALISNVRGLTIAEKTALRPIVEALKLAAPDEKSAIGTGLGQAAKARIAT